MDAKQHDRSFCMELDKLLRIYTIQTDQVITGINIDHKVGEERYSKLVEYNSISIDHKKQSDLHEELEGDGEALDTVQMAVGIGA